MYDKQTRPKLSPEEVQEVVAREVQLTNLIAEKRLADAGTSPVVMITRVPRPMLPIIMAEGQLPTYIFEGEVG